MRVRAAIGTEARMHMHMYMAVGMAAYKTYGSVGAAEVVDNMVTLEQGMSQQPRDIKRSRSIPCTFRSRFGGLVGTSWGGVPALLSTEPGPRSGGCRSPSAGTVLGSGVAITGSFLEASGSAEPAGLEGRASLFAISRLAAEMDAQ